MATATIELRGSVDSVPGAYNCTIQCSDCSHTTFALYREKYGDAEEWAQVLTHEHLAQHDPGRALDIEVSYEVVADCSVCEDGGNIQQEDSETIRCYDCGTAWMEDGKGGEIAEDWHA